MEMLERYSIKSKKHARKLIDNTIKMKKNVLLPFMFDDSTAYNIVFTHVIVTDDGGLGLVSESDSDITWYDAEKMSDIIYNNRKILYHNLDDDPVRIYAAKKLDIEPDDIY